MRTSDERAGHPWSTFLPFPVHVVSSMTQTDLVTGRTTATAYRYERGRYDGLEREFRGFERVTMRVQGDAHSPSAIQETTFFQGEGPGSSAAGTQTGRSSEARARERALAGSAIAVRTFEEDEHGVPLLQQSATMSWTARLEFAGGDRFVHFPHVVRTEARDHLTGEADRIDTAEYEYDRFGNLVSKRRTGRFDGQPDSAVLVTTQRVTYAVNEEAGVTGLPASIETFDGADRLIAHTQHLYDGPDFDGLPVGQVTSARRFRPAMPTPSILPGGSNRNPQASTGRRSRIAAQQTGTSSPSETGSATRRRFSTTPTRSSRRGWTLRTASAQRRPSTRGRRSRSKCVLPAGSSRDTATPRSVAFARSSTRRRTDRFS
jgi:YD repeat-containing protein